MNLEQFKPIKSQLRLIIPQSWIFKLDTIATSRFISRLALIRHYLRLHLDKDLESLRTQLALNEANTRTVKDFNAYKDSRSFKE